VIVDLIKISHRSDVHVEQFPHAVFPTTCAELVKVTGGEPAYVA
jgi:hypothetical protein